MLINTTLTVIPLETRMRRSTKHSIHRHSGLFFTLFRPFVVKSFDLTTHIIAKPIFFMLQNEFCVAANYVQEREISPIKVCSKKMPVEFSCVMVTLITAVHDRRIVEFGQNSYNVEKYES